jgi:hypothetical protein
LLIKVLLIDVDSKIPNLALMKISAFHKQKGDTVFLNSGCDPDKVYISCIFKKNHAQAMGIGKMFNCPIEWGGSGIDLTTKLPLQIEYMKPDYDLYGIDYSMGFTSRGCIRKCEFCVVPKKEGPICHHEYIPLFLGEGHKKVVLLDNNFLASPTWEENLGFIWDFDLKVNFNQGLDIRLINEKNAAFLQHTKYYDFDFRDRRLYFAWDWMELEETVEKGIQTLKDAGIPGRHLTFYVLMGFNTTIEQDRYRAEKLTEWGVDPFAMPMDNGGSRELRKLVRSINRKEIWYTLHPRT